MSFRKDDWNKKGPNIPAALGCKKIAMLAVFGFFAASTALAGAAALAVRWLA